MIINRIKQIAHIHTKETNLIIVVVIIGVILRLCLAKGSYNLDITNFILNYEIFKKGENLYLSQKAYNYSPLFYYIIIMIGKLGDLLNINNLALLIRSFLTVVDIATVIILIKLADVYKSSKSITVAAFFLNPVSIIITGHHGQFENITILLLLCSLLLYEQGKKQLSKANKTAIFTLLALSVVVKHILVFHPILILKRIWKPTRLVLIIYGLIIVFFLVSFIPFIVSAFPQVITQVFKYDGLGGFYGISHIYLSICPKCTIGDVQFHHLYKYVFVLVLFASSLMLRTRTLLKDLLVQTLIFLAFTPGIGAQFFILPIAFGSLHRSKWFALYSVVTTMFYLSNPDEIGKYPFQLANWNSVWIFVILWLASEFRLYSTLKRIYENKFHK